MDLTTWRHTLPGITNTLAARRCTHGATACDPCAVAVAYLTDLARLTPAELWIAYFRVAWVAHTPPGTAPAKYEPWGAAFDVLDNALHVRYAADELDRLDAYALALRCSASDLVALAENTPDLLADVLAGRVTA